MARPRSDQPDSGTNQPELAEPPPTEDKPVRVYAIRRGEYGGHRLVVAEMPTSVLERYAFREDEPDPLWISLARLNREVQIQVEKG